MRKSKAKIRAEALALSAMMATMNVVPALADNQAPEFTIEANELESDNIDNKGDSLTEDLESSEESESENDSQEDTENQTEGEIKEDVDTENESDNNGDNSESDSLDENTENNNHDAIEDTENSESVGSTEESIGSSETETDTEIETEESSENSSSTDGGETNTEEDKSETNTEEDTEEEIESELENDLEQEIEEESLEEKEIMPLSDGIIIWGGWNTSEDRNWQFIPSEDGTCEIKPLSKEMKTGDVIIPGEIAGFKVIKIAERAWYKCTELTSIEIPDSVITIGEKAFDGCTSLKEKVTITFYKNDGTEDIHKRDKINKGDIPDYTDQPERDNYEFMGWYLKPECAQPVDPNEPIEENIDVYAGWDWVDNEHISFSYWLNDGTDGMCFTGGTNKGNNPEQEHLDYVPERYGYEFTGWYLEPECINKATVDYIMEQDTNFYAGWKKEEKINIIYWMNDDTGIAYSSIMDTEKGIYPDLTPKPEREGYEFTGWYMETECETEAMEDMLLEQDTNFYAGWKKIEEEKVIVTYWMNDDTDTIYLNMTDVTKGTYPDLSFIPERNEYEFTGWYMEPECIKEARPFRTLEQDTNFYAGWKKKDTGSGSGGSGGGGGSSEETKPEESSPNTNETDPEETTPSETEPTIPSETEPETEPSPSTPEESKPSEENKPTEPSVEESKPSEDNTQEKPTKPDTIPHGNGGGGSHSDGGSSTVTVNVYEKNPEQTPQPQNDTQDENQRDAQEETLDTTTLDENGIPRDRAEAEPEQLHELPKTGDINRKNILIYWITFISSLSGLLIMKIIKWREEKDR